MSDPVETVLVTAASGTNTGTQVMHALMMLPDKYRLVVTNMEPNFLGQYQVGCSYVVPPASSPDYIEKILEICRQEKVNYLVPGSEPELNALSTQANQINASNTTLLANNPAVIELCMDKVRTVDFLRQKGFPFARSLALDLHIGPDNIDQEATDILKQLSPPLVIKPYRNTGGSKGIHLVQSKAELIAVLSRLSQNDAGSYMLQEYEGSAEEEYTVGVMSDPNGNAFSCFALKRLVNSTLTRLLHIPNRIKERITDDYLTISTGISQGWVDDFPEVRHFCIEVAQALGSTGPINIQCRKTPYGIIIFEINPRFSGTTSIRALCGHNDPDLIIRSRKPGPPMTQVPYKHGLVLRTLQNIFMEGIEPA